MLNVSLRLPLRDIEFFRDIGCVRIATLRDHLVKPLYSVVGAHISLLRELLNVFTFGTLAFGLSFSLKAELDKSCDGKNKHRKKSNVGVQKSITEGLRVCNSENN
jgi:hypothetical protein